MISELRVFAFDNEAKEFPINFCKIFLQIIYLESFSFEARVPGGRTRYCLIIGLSTMSTGNFQQNSIYVGTNSMRKGEERSKIILLV